MRPSAQHRVLAWAATDGRDLPWRHTRDPWAVLVSEVMAQQTQVDRVIPKWMDFLAQFPDVASCAAAPLGDIVRAWHGLGYPRRGKNLHAAACMIMQEHAGSVPTRLADLMSLPGIGPYTARAVLAFAFEQDMAVVDTNVARVLARTGGRALRRSEVQALADAAVPLGKGWAWNQAMLDLGATVCAARRVDCVRCPLRADCRWKGSGSDPAVGSAGVSGGQARFEGSDRQGRGRLMAALMTGPVAQADLASVMGWPHDHERSTRVAATLVSDGLVVQLPDAFRLP